MLMTQNWMMIVPRKSEKAFDDISLNAMAFTGYLL